MPLSSQLYFPVPNFPIFRFRRKYISEREKKQNFLDIFIPRRKIRRVFILQSIQLYAYFNASDESKTSNLRVTSHSCEVNQRAKSSIEIQKKKILLNVNARNIYNYVTILVFTFTEGNMNATNTKYTRETTFHTFI